MNESDRRRSPLADALGQVIRGLEDVHGQAKGDPPLVVETTKLTGYVPMTRQMLLDAGLVEETPEERAESERLRAQWERQEAEKARVLQAARDALGAVPDPLARKVLSLHTENASGQCEGCDVDRYESWQPEWPCRTVELIALDYGIELPS